MDEFFARKLGNWEVPPPEDGWIRIENELNRRKQITRKYWMAAASLALLLSATAAVVYIQTSLPANQPVAIVETQENTLQRPVEQPLAGNNDIAATQVEKRQKRSVTQQNKNSATSVETATNTQVPAQNNVAVPDITDVSDASDVQNIPDVSDVSDVPEVMNTDLNIPVYTDSWDELQRAQPVKLSQRQTAKLEAKINDKQEVETVTATSPALAPTVIPQYDEITFYDITGSTARSQQRDRWEMTGHFAPMYSYRAISSVPSGVRKSDFDDAESPLLAYAGGVSLSYSVIRRLSVQTGVFYMQMGQSINNVIPVTNMYAAVSSNNSYSKNFVRTSSGSVTVASNLKSDANTTYSSYFNAESQETVATNAVANVSSPAKYRLIEQIGYLEVPLLLRYRIIDHKLSLSVLGGMSANLLINNNVFVDNGSEIVKGGAILMARPVNYSSTFGLGIGYQISRSLSVGFEPSFKYYLHPYTTSSKIDSNPYAFGMFTGVVYCF